MQIEKCASTFESDLIEQLHCAMSFETCAAAHLRNRGTKCADDCAVAFLFGLLLNHIFHEGFEGTLY